MPSTPSGVRLPLVVDVKPQIQLADEAMKPIREKMEEMTKRHEEMVEKMKEMVEEMKAMHQLLISQDNTRAVQVKIGGNSDEELKIMTTEKLKKLVLFC